jgi:hypothetical protein
MTAMPRRYRRRPRPRILQAKIARRRRHHCARRANWPANAARLAAPSVKEASEQPPPQTLKVNPMNKLLSSAFALVLAACGAHANDAQVKDAPGTKTAFALHGSLASVQAAAAQNGAAGLWTKITVNYQIPCTESLASFSYDLRNRDDGKVDLLLSAIGTRIAPQPGTAHCQSIMLVPKTVTVPGILAADAINLVNLDGPAATVPEHTAGIAPIGLTLKSVRSLCPQGALCEIGGTVVTLETTDFVTCIDQIAPVTHAVETLADGKVRLAVGATNMATSLALGCVSMKKTVEVDLPFVFASAQDIELTVVGGN